MKRLEHCCHATLSGLLSVLMLALLLSACAGARTATVKPTEEQAVTDRAKEQEAFAIGAEAYIFGYPLVTMEMTRRVMTNAAAPMDNHAPMGQFTAPGPIRTLHLGTLQPPTRTPSTRSPGLTSPRNPIS